MNLKDDVLESKCLADAVLWVKNEFASQGIENPMNDTDFFDGGGTSLGAIDLVCAAEARFGSGVLTPDTLFEISTVLGIARVLRGHPEISDQTRLL